MSDRSELRRIEQALHVLLTACEEHQPPATDFGSLAVLNSSASRQ